MVGVRCGANEDFDFVGLSACFGEKFLYGLDTHVRRALVGVAEYVALFDADTGGNPFVVGVDHLREHFVIEDAVGNVRGNA